METASLKEAKTSKTHKQEESIPSTLLVQISTALINSKHFHLKFCVFEAVSIAVAAHSLNYFCVNHILMK